MDYADDIFLITTLSPLSPTQVKTVGPCTVSSSDYVARQCFIAENLLCSTTLLYAPSSIRRNQKRETGVDRIQLAQDSCSGGSCEHGNESEGII
jgi:hypothetical protein